MSKINSKAVFHRLDKKQEAAIEQNLLEMLVPYMSVVPPFNYTASMKCTENGLLPPHLLDALDVLLFLSYTVLAAQKAQRIYSVRASVLLAMALHESNFEANNLVKSRELLDDCSNVRVISPEVDRWFLRRAKELATSKRFKKAMALKSDVEKYIYEIGRLGFCDDLTAQDYYQNIITYELQSCDRAGMVPLGEYRHAQMMMATL